MPSDLGFTVASRSGPSDESNRAITPLVSILAMYAVIASGGKQEKVAEGQRVQLELLGADEGSDVSLTPVMVVDGSTDYNQRDLELRFSLKDENNPQEIIDAVYNGAKPDAFEPEIEALLEGTYDRSKNLFQAETLLVKCPSKYESETVQDNKQEVGK